MRTNELPAVEVKCSVCGFACRSTRHALIPSLLVNVSAVRDGRGGPLSQACARGRPRQSPEAVGWAGRMR